MSSVERIPQLTLGDPFGANEKQIPGHRLDLRLLTGLRFRQLSVSRVVDSNILEPALGPFQRLPMKRVPFLLELPTANGDLVRPPASLLLEQGDAVQQILERVARVLLFERPILDVGIAPPVSGV